MRLATYLFAAALLWAIASSGPPATSAAEPAPRNGRHAAVPAPPLPLPLPQPSQQQQRSLAAYPK
jgi:hypothetical protein